ncbi:hypothetical protein [Tissierella creatinophila]|uniref:Uncharacterized protein n=1 Tax=Tissierella creatinophila DSM 6911 TaxID=1123403 RepID=A0A1U7M6S2_TISCR|nr:hypothetical protein [Tissierella creatinophila]OLS02909.1 hypothetical protein TICRE_10630 [Tissierella creatinophila DSM 6911]
MEDRKLDLIIKEATRLLREHPGLTYMEAIRIAKETFKDKEID